MKKIVIVLCVIAVAGLSGCSTAPKTTEAREVLSAQVDETVAIFKNTDPEIQSFFDTSYGYAVFPKVAKGAFIFGGTHGKGEVYEQGQMIGYSSLSGASAGFSFGGEFFREIIFFKNKQYFDEFLSDEYTISANLSAVVLTAGAARKSSYDKGKVVFVKADSGLMVDASLGGQKFNYIPVSLARR